MSAPSETAGWSVGTSAAVPPGERRRHVRYSFTATALALEPKSDTRIEARTADLSSAGCYLDTMVPFPVGSRVQLRISHDGRSFECEARVAFSQAGMGMGLAFVKFLPEHYKVLQEWLTELRGETIPLHQLPAQDSGAAHPQESPKAEIFALNELVQLLLKKGLLTDEEGERVLRKLFGADQVL